MKSDGASADPFGDALAWDLKAEGIPAYQGTQEPPERRLLTEFGDREVCEDETLSGPSVLLDESGVSVAGRGIYDGHGREGSGVVDETLGYMSPIRENGRTESVIGLHSREAEIAASKVSLYLHLSNHPSSILCGQGCGVASELVLALFPTIFPMCSVARFAALRVSLYVFCSNHVSCVY